MKLLLKCECFSIYRNQVKIRAVDKVEGGSFNFACRLKAIFSGLVFFDRMTIAVTLNELS